MTASSAVGGLEIRHGVPSDRGAIEALYPRAFPDEDLLPVVRDLIDHPGSTVSLVAVINSHVVGHVGFTRCTVDDGDDDVALLAPLAVDPGWQRRGIGSALVREGLRRLRDEAVRAVYVLGDPAYYGRLGFSPERSVTPPYPLPAAWADAWQSRGLGNAALPKGGRLSLPEFWLDPALWSG